MYCAYAEVGKFQIKVEKCQIKVGKTFVLETVVATEAASKAGQRKTSHGARSRAQLKHRQQRSTRERLRIIDVEKEIQSDPWACMMIRRGGARGSFQSNTVMNTPSKKRSLCCTSGVMARMCKRYKPGD